MVVLSLIISMGIILFMVSKKMNIGHSLMVGATFLALINGRNFSYISNVFLKSFIDPTTITLVLTILLITILGHMMEKYLILDRMIISLEQILRSAKATILIAPAIIGTLLVTGGALMSCPVVENLGDKLNLSKDKRASINLIFRHALYFMFPLSTTMILAAEVGNYSIWDFIKLQFPIALAMYIFGYIFYLKDCQEPKMDRIEFKQYIKAITRFLIYSSPILASLLGVVLLNLPFYISLIFGILLNIMIHSHDKKQDIRYNLDESLLTTLYHGINPSMAMAIIGIMIFKNVINDMDEIYTHLNSLLDKGIPIEILILLACSMISFPLASIQPSIAMLYPIILPLAPDHGTQLLYAMFIYTSAFIFYYISPLHLCQVLTLEYFEVRIKDLYKNYIYILPMIYVVMLILYAGNRINF